MKLRQLEYFLAVVEEGSFTSAAARMHVAQPSLSQQVRALELELGGPLLERMPRRIGLTPAGRTFLAPARMAVRAATQAAHRARLALDAESGELHIVTLPSLALGVLPESLGRWREVHPEVVIRLHEFAQRTRMETEVREGLGDVAIGPRPDSWDGPVESLGFERFVVVLPAPDPLLRRRSVRLERLAERDWVLFHADHGLSPVVEDICEAAGFRPHPALRTAHADVAAQLAAAGLGPAMLPDNAVPSDLKHLARPLTVPVVRELVAYTRFDWSSLAASYLTAIRANEWAGRPRGAVVLT